MKISRNWNSVTCSCRLLGRRATEKQKKVGMRHSTQLAPTVATSDQPLQRCSYCNTLAASSRCYFFDTSGSFMAKVNRFLRTNCVKLQGRVALTLLWERWKFMRSLPDVIQLNFNTVENLRHFVALSLRPDIISPRLTRRNSSYSIPIVFVNFRQPPHF